MRYAAIGLLAAVLGVGCALQAGDPNGDPSGGPHGSYQLDNGVSPALRSGVSGPAGASSGNPKVNPQPAPWGDPVQGGQTGSTTSDPLVQTSGTGAVLPAVIDQTPHGVGTSNEPTKAWGSVGVEREVADTTRQP